MSFACPYCRHALKVPNFRPGRYRPACPRCGRAFALTIPAEQDRPPTVAALPPPGPNQTFLADPSRRPPAGESTDFGLPDGPALDAPAVRAALEENAPAAGPPPTLGGYELLRELGRGGVGTVYRARQLSLDRPVAVKVLDPRWACDPKYLAWFTHEAHAAAKLVHPNVVQIYDIGEQDGTHFFSMELVEGPSLGQLLRDEGPLDPARAVGYVVQAARGLQFAHLRGLVHRDIKPENLLLDPAGVVKVADMGLAKLPDGEGLATSPETGTERTAMGTPAYMAPEQARDAWRVDERADVYSLGCTLYALLTGRPPFVGGSALDVMTRHAHERPVPPDGRNPRVPAALSAIVLKMLAKRPESRHARMGEVVEALEDWLGHHSGAAAPREDDILLLEECVRRFADVPAARRRPVVLAGSFVALSLPALAGLLLGRSGLFFGGLALLTLTGLVGFVAHGLSRRSPLFEAVRDLVCGFGVLGGIGAVVVTGLGLLVVGLLHLLAALLVAVALGLVLGVAWEWLLNRPVERQRRGPLEQAEQLLKRLRLRGLSEEAVRRFVAANAGPRWEEFYEALFGYEAKLAVRPLVAALGNGRTRYAAWREPILAGLAAWRAARARRRTALGEPGLPLREEKTVGTSPAARPEPPAPPAVVERPAMAPATTASPSPPRHRGRERLASVARALAGAVLLTGCVLWAGQNGFLPGSAEDLRVPDLSDWSARLAGVRPLRLRGLPDWLGDCFADFNPAAAGLALLLSGLRRGLGVGLFMVPGAMLIWLGSSLGMPPLGPVTPAQVSLGLGLGLTVFGYERSRRMRWS